MNETLQNWGLMIALAYMIIILGTWIKAVSEGEIYFQAGEPNEYIRNAEWVLGLFSIFILIGLLTKN